MGDTELTPTGEGGWVSSEGPSNADERLRAILLMAWRRQIRVSPRVFNAWFRVRSFSVAWYEEASAWLPCFADARRSFTAHP